MNKKEISTNKEELLIKLYVEQYITKTQHYKTLKRIREKKEEGLSQ